MQTAVENPQKNKSSQSYLIPEKRKKEIRDITRKGTLKIAEIHELYDKLITKHSDLEPKAGAPVCGTETELTVANFHTGPTPVPPSINIQVAIADNGETFNNKDHPHRFNKSLINAGQSAPNFIYLLDAVKDAAKYMSELVSKPLRIANNSPLEEAHYHSKCYIAVDEKLKHEALNSNARLSPFMFLKPLRFLGLHDHPRFQGFFENLKVTIPDIKGYPEMQNPMRTFFSLLTQSGPNISLEDWGPPEHLNHQISVTLFNPTMVALTANSPNVCSYYEKGDEKNESTRLLRMTRDLGPYAAWYSAAQNGTPTSMQDFYSCVAENLEDIPVHIDPFGEGTKNTDSTKSETTETHNQFEAVRQFLINSCWDATLRGKSSASDSSSRLEGIYEKLKEIDKEPNNQRLEREFLEAVNDYFKTCYIEVRGFDTQSTNTESLWTTHVSALSSSFFNRKMKSSKLFILNNEGELEIATPQNINGLLNKKELEEGNLNVARNGFSGNEYGIIPIPGNKKGEYMICKNIPMKESTQWFKELIIEEMNTLKIDPETKKYIVSTLDQKINGVEDVGSPSDERLHTQASITRRLSEYTVKWLMEDQDEKGVKTLAKIRNKLEPFLESHNKLEITDEKLANDLALTILREDAARTFLESAKNLANLEFGRGQDKHGNKIIKMIGAKLKLFFTPHDKTESGQGEAKNKPIFTKADWWTANNEDIVSGKYFRENFLESILNRDPYHLANSIFV